MKKKNKKIKIKTRKSLVKRLKLTKKDKVLFRGSHVRHLRRKKGKSQIRRQKRPIELKGKIKSKIKKLIKKK